MGLFNPKPRPKGIKGELGAEGELVIASELLRSGYLVWRPQGNQRYDLVIEDAENRFWRIQCKTGWLGQNGEILRFHTVSHHYHYRGGQYTQHYKRGYVGQVDYFAIYSPDLNKVYLIPISHCTAKEMSLRLTSATKNYQVKGVKYAADYIL